MKTNTMYQNTTSNTATKIHRVLGKNVILKNSYPYVLKLLLRMVLKINIKNVFITQNIATNVLYFKTWFVYF